jgi:alanine racemase
MEDAARADITLTVCDRENIAALQGTCQRARLQAKVHLKADTGMGRIGASPAETPELATWIETKCPNLVLEGLYTHLPVSDTGDAAYTRDQVNRFKSIVDDVNTAIGRRVSLVHCASSGAILGHPGAWLDLVRPGIMLYGYHPGPETPHTIPLRPGMSFITKVSFLKKVSAGTSIGYGRTWFAPQDTWIATIPVGYADGFNRLFSNRGRVLIGGEFYPVVGRVCMDQSMVDLGAETSVRVGDEVTLIGASGGQVITADDWARLLGTISYEVLCQVNARVPRLYD